MINNLEVPEGLFSHMLNILNAEISGGEIMFNKMFSEIMYSHEKYLFEKELKRKQDNCLSGNGVWLLFGKSGGPKTIKVSEALMLRMFEI